MKRKLAYMTRTERQLLLTHGWTSMDILKSRVTVSPPSPDGFPTNEYVFPTLATARVTLIAQHAPRKP